MASNFSKQEEIELIERAQQGDEKAAEMLIKDLKSTAYAAIPDPTALKNEEVKAQVLLSIWKSISKFEDRGDARLATFAYKVVRNDFLTNIRREKKHQSYSLYDSKIDNNSEQDNINLLEALDSEEFPGIIQASVVNPEKLYFQNLEKESIFNLIERANLSKKKKTILTMLLQGLQYSEISKILSIPEGTVKSNLFRAREQILERKKYEEEVNALEKGKWKHRQNIPLKVQREIFSGLIKKLGIPAYKMPTKLLDKYNLYAPGHKSGHNYQNKDNAINRLLPSGEKIPSFLFNLHGKWKGKRGKVRANQALEYIVLNHRYFLDYEFPQKNAWTHVMLKHIFNYKRGLANKVLQEDILKLTPIEQKKYKLLRTLTNNDSMILGGEFENATEKVQNHLRILDNLIEETDLDGKQRQILDLWINGEGWDYMANNFSYLFKEGGKHSRNFSREFEALNKKLKIRAIQKYQEKFEKCENIEEIKNRVKYGLERGFNTNLWNRYLRFNLQAYLETIAENQGIHIDEIVNIPLTKNSNIVNISKLFGGSISDLIKFLYPGKFEDWQLPSRSRWVGKNGRKNALQAVEYITKKEGTFFVDKNLLRKYNMTTMPRQAFNSLSIANLNNIYLQEHLREKYDMLSDHEKFQKYSSNLKFLTLLLDNKNIIFSSEEESMDEKILEINREHYYDLANLSEFEKTTWESYIRNYAFTPKGYNLKEITKELGKFQSPVINIFRSSKKKLLETILD